MSIEPYTHAESIVTRSELLWVICSYVSRTKIILSVDSTNEWACRVLTFVYIFWRIHRQQGMILSRAIVELLIDDGNRVILSKARCQSDSRLENWVNFLYPIFRGLVSGGHIFSPSEKEAISLVGPGPPLELIGRLVELGAEVWLLVSDEGMDNFDLKMFGKIRWLACFETNDEHIFARNSCFSAHCICPSYVNAWSTSPL